MTEKKGKEKGERDDGGRGRGKLGETEREEGKG